MKNYFRGEEFRMRIYNLELVEALVEAKKNFFFFCQASLVSWVSWIKIRQLAS